MDEPIPEGGKPKVISANPLLARSCLQRKSLLWFLLFAAPAWGSAEAQVCPEGRISSVQIETLDVFQLDEGAPLFLKWVLRGANSIHINTRESYIRSELLFREGDCLDPFVLDETARTLRSRPFIKWAELTQTSLQDGTEEVRVVVQDDWTLSFGLGLSFDEGINLEELLLRETNLLGRGMTVGVARAQSREVLETSVRFGTARLFGTSFSVAASGGETRAGSFFEQDLFRPFTSELSRVALRQSYSYREDYFPYSATRAGSISHVLLPYRWEVFQLTSAVRFGEPGSLWMLGAGISREELSYPEGIEGLRSVADGDFGELLPAGADEFAEVQGQIDPLEATRLNLLFGFRSVTFILREGLDAVLAPQDVQVGTEATLSLGPSLGFLAGDDDSEDVHARLDLSWSKAPGSWVLATDINIGGRYLRSTSPGSGGWRDILSEVDAKAFLRVGENRPHTLLGRVSAARSWSMNRPFQLTAGGREGVRGYSQDAFPGGRRLLFTLEDRVPVLESGIADAGLVFFGDVGRVWGQDVPYGVNSGWRSSLGAGVRFNLPGGALETVRADFTLPLSGDRDTHGIYFRFYTEIGGLLQIPKRPGQVERSRWSGPDTRLTVDRSKG